MPPALTPVTCRCGAAVELAPSPKGPAWRCIMRRRAHPDRVRHLELVIDATPMRMLQAFALVDNIPEAQVLAAASKSQAYAGAVTLAHHGLLVRHPHRPVTAGGVLTGTLPGSQWVTERGLDLLAAEWLRRRLELDRGLNGGGRLGPHLAVDDQPERSLSE